MKSTLPSITAMAVAALFAFPANAQDSATQLTVAESEEHGSYIADGEGMALYMFEIDTQGQGDTQAVSECYEACAEAWPPLTAEGTPEAGEQVQSDLIGTFEREDGTMQVTYNGWPLYYFVRDEGPGDTAGHDVEGHGGEWYLLTPEGEQVGH